MKDSEILDYMLNGLSSHVLDIREAYYRAKESGDRETQREIIRSLWMREWMPTVGFVADAVDEPRAVIAATVQEQGWIRGKPS